MELTKHNTKMNLVMCVNYGARAELADAASRIGALAKEGKLNPDKLTEEGLRKFLYVPDMPDVDLMLRPSGEMRVSNFLLWQSAYAELVVQDKLFPDIDRRDLWAACEEYARRNRRFGKA